MEEGLEGEHQKAINRMGRATLGAPYRTSNVQYALFRKIPNIELKG